MRIILRLLLVCAIAASAETAVICQSAAAAAAHGSKSAKAGFRNENEIAGKFNNWQTDRDARTWLSFMGYRPEDIRRVAATKPHGEKADVEVRITTEAGEKVEGISIKLVSSASGFNQVDKRWLAHYTKMWRMPADVVEPLKLFVGELPPDRPSRDPKRMFLNEFDASTQRRIIEFFALNKEMIVADLLAGDGTHAAGWIMVAQRSSETPRWVLRPIEHAIKLFGEGPVMLTRAGNLKIGRITMQRKGGDGGRESAKMLQFKIDPTLLFEK